MRCAIVGDGLAALVGYATLLHGGLEPDEIAVFGLGSALAVFLFLLVIPILALNVRRFRSESS